jgi:hypothetical protein
MTRIVLSDHVHLSRRRDRTVGLRRREHRRPSLDVEQVGMSGQESPVSQSDASEQNSGTDENVSASEQPAAEGTDADTPQGEQASGDSVAAETTDAGNEAPEAAQEQETPEEEGAPSNEQDIDGSSEQDAENQNDK